MIQENNNNNSNTNSNDILRLTNLQVKTPKSDLSVRETSIKALSLMLTVSDFEVVHQTVNTHYQNIDEEANPTCADGGACGAYLR